MTWAMAAPLTPIPNRKMNIGSNTIFAASPTTTLQCKSSTNYPLFECLFRLGCTSSFRSSIWTTFKLAVDHFLDE